VLTFSKLSATDLYPSAGYVVPSTPSGGGTHGCVLSAVAELTALVKLHREPKVHFLIFTISVSNVHLICQKYSFTNVLYSDIKTAYPTYIW